VVLGKLIAISRGDTDHTCSANADAVLVRRLFDATFDRRDGDDRFDLNGPMLGVAWARNPP
jgi:hypothetical protein